MWILDGEIEKVETNNFSLKTDVPISEREVLEVLQDRSSRFGWNDPDYPTWNIWRDPIYPASIFQGRKGLAI